MRVTLDIKRVTVLITNSGPDKIGLELNAPTPFPEMNYGASADIHARHGYGVEWCRKALGVEPEIIDARTPGSGLPFSKGK